MSNEKQSEGFPDRAGSHDDLLDDVAANPELARVAFLLSARPSDRELSGLDGPLEAFRAQVTAPKPQRRRPSMISTLAGAKLGATIAGIAVGLGGAATVAYVSASTPATPETRATAAATPSQAEAAADAREKGKGEGKKDKATPVGPDATGSAAFGLCTAWKGVAGNGKPWSRSPSRTSSPLPGARTRSRPSAPRSTHQASRATTPPASPTRCRAPRRRSDPR